MCERSFNPARLTFARERRGLTKKSLAAAIGVSAWTVSAYESGSHTPNEENQGAISRVLEFPIQFFSLDDLRPPKPDQASFRSMSSMTAGQRDSALAAGALAIELSAWIEERFTLPEADVPDLRELTPEAAAETIRVEWELGQRPIGSLIHLLEFRGIRILSLAEDCKAVDAFSLWHGTTPFIFLNTLKSAERSRYDSAHELGHLVLHLHGAPSGRQAEEEANAFASYFLMPTADVLANSPRNPSLKSLLNAKARWGVSAMAYVRRLHQVGMLSDWHYRQLCIKFSQLGYRTREPHERKRESSQILKKVFDLLRIRGISRADVARDLAISQDELNKLIFGLILASIKGEGRSDTRSRGRGNLRLV